MSLSGKVTSTYGDYVFAVGSGVERVIVVNLTPARVSRGDTVEVIGRVARFVRQQVESELGVPLGPEVDQLENMPCLVASVARVR